MGNNTSDFEQQFHKLYNFISLVDDPYFKRVKIYRKNRHSFNHIMIAQTPIMQVSNRNWHMSSKAFITQKLSLIRRFQNKYTVQLQYFHLLQQKKYECGAPIIRMYIDYYNYTLLDYLSALRMKKQTLTIDQLLLIIQNLAEAILTLRSRFVFIKEMGLEHYQICLSNIFLVVEDGAILLNPIYFLYDAIFQVYNAKAIHALSKQFQIYTNDERQRAISQSNTLQKKQKQQMHSIVIEMTRYLSQSCLQQSEGILRTLDQCKTISQISSIFICPIDELNIQQFGQASPQNAQLY